MRHDIRSLVAAFAVSAAVLGASPRIARGQVTVQFRYGNRERPLEGRRFETMRALAHYLDERAQQVLSEASATGARGSRQRRFLHDISEFARRASHFHERMDNYLDSPYDLPGEVLALERRAQAVSIRIRDARVFPGTYRDWDAVLDVFNRMKSVLAGEEVQVPPAHRRDFGDHERDYAPFQEPGSPNDPLARPYAHERYGEPGPDVLSESGMGDLRRLAARLDELTTEAHSMAEQGMVESSRPGADFTEVLHHFNEDTRALRQRADAGQIGRREMAGSVDHLLSDAQGVSGRLGGVNADPRLRDQWGRVIDTLNRMAQILRR